MVDRDQKEIKAIKTVFPHASVLLCWFHVLQVCVTNQVSSQGPILLSNHEKEYSFTQGLNALYKRLIGLLKRSDHSSVLQYHLH